MRVLYTSKIDGDFPGWDGDKKYKLVNGTVWEMVQYKYEDKYLYCPAAKIVEEGGRRYLIVEGMTGKVEVREVY